jgi:AmmeMemoRadiSam system protein B
MRTATATRDPSPTRPSEASGPAADEAAFPAAGVATALPAGRLAAYAGALYPADPVELAAQVDGLLDDAATRLLRIPSHLIRGILVPHAGLTDSGAVAAAGWAAVRTIHPRTLVLLGTDHDGSPGVAVWTDGPWSGPLGEVDIDHGLADRIAALGPPFRVDTRDHRQEHSLEVQMPFVERACPGSRIVPLLVGDARPGTAQAAGTWLGRLLAGLRGNGERVVLVVSSDLAHDPSPRAALEVDRRILEPILALDADELGGIELELRVASMSDDAGVCGLGAVSCALTAVEEMGASHGQLLAEAASAGGDALRRRTVGYAAVAFVC